MFDFFKDNSKDEIIKLQEELAKMQEQLAVATSENKQFEERLEKSEQKVKDLNDKWLDRLKENKHLAHQVESLTEDKKKLEERNKELNEKLTGSTADNKELKEKLADAKRANGRLEEKLENAEAEIDSLRSGFGMVDLLKEELHAKTAEPAEPVQPIAEEQAAEETREPRFSRSLDWVVENWVNPEAVFGEWKNEDSRIVDVGLRKRGVSFRLENGAEVETGAFDIRGELPAGKKLDPRICVTDASYVCDIISDLREVMVGKKFGEVANVDILKTLFGENSQIAEVAGDYLLLKESRYGRNVVLKDNHMCNGKMKDMIAALQFSNVFRGPTLKEISDLQEYYFFESRLDACKEIHQKVDALAKDEIYKHLVVYNKYGYEEYFSETASDELKAFCEEELPYRKPGSEPGIGRYMYDNKTVEVFSKIMQGCDGVFSLRCDNVMGDKELAAFGHTVRFHAVNHGVDLLESPTDIKSNWVQANDTRAAVLIQCGLVTKEEGQTLADYRPKIVVQDGKTTVESMPMLSKEAKELLGSLIITGKAITDLTPEEAKVLSRDFKEAAKTIEAEKSKLKQAKEELLADCQQAGKVFAHEGQNMTLEDVGKIYASKVEGQNGGLASFKKEAMEAIVKGYKEEKQKLADKQKGSKNNNKSQDKGSRDGERG